jgi:pimeloyl-ACP methyl ester carboxylesterase
METLTSSNGCRIAYDRSGSGPPLVLVGGAFSSRASAAPIASELAADFTVYCFDRRGRGDSDDQAEYATEREVEDLAAVIEVAGGDAFVFGQSSGGALTLESAAAGASIRALVVNEPPYTGTAGSSLRRADELAALIAAGHPDRAAELFMRGSGIPKAVIEQTKASPGWQGMVEIAHTLSYDVRVCNDGVVPVDRLGRISCPVLATAGGASPTWAPAVARTIAGAVNEGEWRTLEGLGHNVPVEVLGPLLRERFLG